MNGYSYCVPPTMEEETVMTPLFLRILSPVDFHENSLAALEYTAALARQYGAMVYLLHVVPPPEKRHLYSDVYRSKEGERFDPAQVEQVATEKLQDLARARLGNEIRYEILTRVGEAATVVLATAEAVEAELIVMATHGRTGIAHFFLGSVAERVVREARCPVLTIRGT
jgi:nucleotide-binding universal stress UspA family protein